jgi:hypothetical protein
VAGALPDGGATEMLLRELERRADGGRAAACAKERAAPHFSFRFQFCGKADTSKEVAGLKRQLAQKKAGSRDAVALQRGIALYEEGWISRRRLFTAGPRDAAGAAAAAAARGRWHAWQAANETGSESWAASSAWRAARAAAAAAGDVAHWGVAAPL